ncbi:MAG TPA: DUF3604 domain-containing protein [Falsiroseomonas sp.]|nr:DUF3604 domain-containing protein [Falsiroseomonas sp.]
MTETCHIDNSGAAGRAEIGLPAEVVAGEPVALRVVIRPGRACPAGARVALVRHWPADWAIPQAEDPAAPDHLRVVAEPSGLVLQWERARRLDWHPFDHAIVATLPQAIGAAEEIVFASPALGAQTFMEERCPLSVRFDADGNGAWVEIARHHLRVTGGAPHRLVATAPSDAAAGETVEVHLRVEDVWGNPARFAPMAVEVAGATGTLRAEDGAVLRLPVRIAEAGVHRLEARSATGLAATSNPVRVHASAPRLRRHWGDIHAQSAIGCGARSVEAYFRHARDFAATDFGSHQANCFMVTAAEWEETQQVTQALHAPGRFVTLLGVEWSGVPAVGGDHNVYFPGDRAELRRCSHKLVEDKSDLDTDLPHATDLHAHYRGKDVLMAVHVGGRTSNLTWHEPSVERLVEVHSTHATSDWILTEALERGWRFGVTGGSDGVDGRLGASHPGRQSVRILRGGLTAVNLPELTRPALWEALRAGRTYGTNGPRILLDVTPQGDGAFHIAVEGTAPLAAVTLFRGVEAMARAPLAPEDPAPSGWLRLRWWGASGRGNFSQTRMVWDGSVEIEGSTFEDAAAWRFDTPAEGVAACDAQRVTWRSATAGSWDGVLLRPGTREGAMLRFRSRAMEAEIALDALAAGPVELTAPGVAPGRPERRLVLEALPRRAAPPGWSGVLADPAPGGAHWVKVEQEDGGIAWSSPIWRA